MLSKFKYIFKEISTLSYNIFLIHSQIIPIILRCYNPIKWKQLIIFLSVTITLTMIYSKMLLITVNYSTQTKYFKKNRIIYFKRIKSIKNIFYSFI